MSKQSKKTLNLVLLAVGIALICWGFNEYGAFGNKFARALSSRVSDRVMLLWIAGGVLSAVGLFGLSKGK